MCGGLRFGKQSIDKIALSAGAVGSIELLAVQLAGRDSRYAHETSHAAADITTLFWARRAVVRHPRTFPGESQIAKEACVTYAVGLWTVHALALWDMAAAVGVPAVRCWREHGTTRASRHAARAPLESRRPDWPTALPARHVGVPWTPPLPEVYSLTLWVSL